MRFIRLFFQIIGVFVGVLVLLFALFMAWAWNKSKHASEDSVAFCAEFPVGAPVADMVAAAQKRLIIHREDKEDHAYEFIFPTGIGLGMEKCVISERGGKVSAKKTISQED